MQEEKIVKFFTDLLENPAKIGNVEQVIKDAGAQFEEILDLIQNGSPEQQESVQTALEQVGKKLSSKLESLYEETGISKEELESMMKNPDNFSAEMWTSLNDFQTMVGRKNPTEEEPIRKKSTNLKKTKKWLTA